MLAVQVKEIGGPEVLVPTEVPDPVPRPGQVVVDVSVADVIFLETQLRAGWGQDFFPVHPPYVPGGAVAGTVTGTGDGVDTGWLGRTVATRTAGGGGYAERALAGADDLIVVPEGLDLRVAAGLLHDGPTALGLFEGAGVRPGEWVLVTGAAGGLGVLLVQLARSAGARVVAAARGERKLRRLGELGADVVVDYSEPDWAGQVREATGGAGPSVVFDGVGGPIGGTAFTIAADGGRFSAHGAPSGDFAPVDEADAARRGIRVRGIEQVQFPPAEARRLAGLAMAEAATGRIAPVIGQTFPLVHAAEAHAAIEARSTVGKTLLLA